MGGWQRGAVDRGRALFKRAGRWLKQVIHGYVMRGPCPWQCQWKMQHIGNILTAIHMSVPGQCPCQCMCEIAQGAISHAHGQHTYISGAHVQHPFVLVSTLQSLYEWAISQLNNCYYSGAYPHYPLITNAFSGKSFHTRGQSTWGRSGLTDKINPESRGLPII